MERAVARAEEPAGGKGSHRKADKLKLATRKEVVESAAWMRGEGGCEGEVKGREDGAGTASEAVRAHAKAM